MPNTSMYLRRMPTLREETQGVVQHADHPFAFVSPTAPPDPRDGFLWLDPSATGTGGTGLLSRVTTTVDLTLTTSHTVVLVDASAGPRIITLPAASANGGRLYHIKKADPSANVVTVDGDGDDTIDGGATAVLTEQWESLAINGDSAEDNWDILMAYNPQPITTEGGQKKAVVSDPNVEQVLAEILVELRKNSVQLALMNDNAVSGDELD